MRDEQEEFNKDPIKFIGTNRKTLAKSRKGLIHYPRLQCVSTRSLLFFIDLMYALQTVSKQLQEVKQLGIFGLVLLIAVLSEAKSPSKR